jgi:long-chain fatty acid transport protein
MPSEHNLHLGTNRLTQIGGIAAALFLCVAFSPRPVFGLGLAVPDQDAFATARGNAFVATANDPAAVFYNPAGISQLDGLNFSAGAYGIVDGDRYSGPRGSVNSKTQWSALPQVFSTLTLSNYNLAFGLGVFSPYGLRMEWPNTAPFLAVGDTGQVTYERLAGIVSWQIAPILSIAAGPTLNYSEVDLKEYVSFPPGIPLPSFVNHFRGRATDAGYTAGLLFHPGEQHYIGLTYRSATEMNYNGHATDLDPFPNGKNIAASADFHYPETLAFGYSFRPNEKWNFEGDLNWTDWSSLHTVTVRPLGEALDFNWTPSWILGFGVTRYLANEWRVSGGYMYSENSVPDGNFNPLVPDSDRHVFSIGVGKRCGRFSWDAAYQLAWGPPRSIGGDANVLADGKYQFLSHALTINIGYHF